MKRFLAIIVASVLILCSCSNEALEPPELNISQRIYHNSGTEFDITRYCRSIDVAGKDVLVEYEGVVDVDTLGDYNITVTATDKNGLSTSEDVIVTVRRNRSHYSSDTVYLLVKDYIEYLQNNGFEEIGFIGYADGFGYIADAVSTDNMFSINGNNGIMIFEAYQTKEEKQSVFNMIFEIDKTGMDFLPMEVSIVAGDDEITLPVDSRLSSDARYGFVIALHEQRDYGSFTFPDYDYIEKLRRIAHYDGNVFLNVYQNIKGFRMTLTDKQKENMRNIFYVYDEMLQYY